jgi:hypothetical protein
MSDNRPRWLAATLVVLLTAAHSAAFAQDPLPLLDDASLVPRGLLRLRSPLAFTRYEQRFASSGTTDLGAAFTADSLGSSRLGPLATSEALTQTASASPFKLSLGKSHLDGLVREEHMPFMLEYGLLDRLSISVMVPIIRKRLTGLFRLDSLGANVGPNPQRLSASAAATNNTVQLEINSAVLQLQSQLSNCTLGPAGCANLAGRVAEANQLILDSQAFASAVGSLYGKTGSSGEAFVPRASSAAQSAIAARVSAFNTKYKDLLSSSGNLLVSVPVGSAGPAGASDVTNYVLNDLGRDSINGGHVLGIGDWELGAKYLLVNRVRERGRSLRVLVASSVSFPSGKREAPVGVADLRIAHAALGYDVRAIAEWKAGRTAITGAASTTMFGRNAAMPPGGDTRLVTSEWEPRWHVSAPLSIHGSYALRVGDETGSMHFAGGGVSFTTISGYKRGDKPLPMEMRYTHLEAIKGAVGAPKFTRDQLEIRLYYRLGQH